MAGKEKHPVITRRAPAPAVVLAALLGLLLAVATLLVGLATSAQAHDVLIGTTPADGATTAVVPASLMLTFGAPVLAIGTVIIVTGPAGQVQTGKVVLFGNVVTQHLRPGSPAGRYNVVWRVSSADGHPVSGQFSFTARAPSPGTPATTQGPPATTGTTSSSTTSTSPAPVTTGAASASTPSTAEPAGQSSALWWVIGVGVLLLALLLTAAYLVTRKPRSTPQDERDPKS